MGNWRADVESCEKFITSRVEDNEKFQEADKSCIAEGFECEVKKLGLKEFLGIEESIWNLDQGECYQSNLKIIIYHVNGRRWMTRILGVSLGIPGESLVG